MRKEFKQIVYKNLPNSAYSKAKHYFGRHNQISAPQTNQFELTSEVRIVISKIFDLQSSSPWIIKLENSNYHKLKECCKSKYENLKKNPVTVCQSTRMDYNSWKEERKYRITGSRCYGLYTYSFNKNPDWSKKSSKYFNPGEFKS